MVGVVIPLYGEYEAEYEPVRAALEQLDATVIPVVDEHGAGFTPTVNRGLREALNWGHASIDYIWVLNQNAVPMPGALDALVKRMQENPQCGIVASMQVHPDDEDFITYGGSGPVVPGVHFTGHVSDGQHLTPKKMQWANGASMLLRVSMLREIGLLDEKLKMICSDSDISFRARYAGWEVWYEPLSRVKHILGFSANPPDARKWAMGQDMRRFQEKWQGGAFKELALEVFD